MKDEEVVKPDILGKVDDPLVRAELVNFRAPSPHERNTLRQAQRLAEHFWPIMGERPVSSAEMVEWSQQNQHLPEQGAKIRVKIALEWFKRKGVEVE